jgi:hypothetical protein
MSADQPFHEELLKQAKPIAAKVKAPVAATKTIYNYKYKTPLQIKAALTVELEYLKRKHPGYVLDDISKPTYNNDGSCTYYITLKIG